MIVSFSHVLKHQSCERQYYYGYILNLMPLEENDSIDTGVKGHKLLQRFYELTRDGKTKEEALGLVRDIAASDIDTNMLKAWITVDNYVKDNDFNKVSLHIEQQFKIPVYKLLPEELVTTATAYNSDIDWQIGFTPDLVQERPGNKIDVEDYKFVQRFWTQPKINRFSQVKLYKIFLERMGYEVSRSVLRLFNISTGKIKYQNYTPTKIEEENLLRDFLRGAQRVVDFNKLPEGQQALAPITMNYFICQFCPFEYPCTLEQQGKDVSKLLATQYRIRDYGYS